MSRQYVRIKTDYVDIKRVHGHVIGTVVKDGKESFEIFKDGDESKKVLEKCKDYIGALRAARSMNEKESTPVFKKGTK